MDEDQLDFWPLGLFLLVGRMGAGYLCGLCSAEVRLRLRIDLLTDGASPAPDLKLDEGPDWRFA